jgi:hypothetical protein
MRDSHDQNNELVILDCVDDSVVADSNPPKSVVSDQRSATRGPWVAAELVDCFDDSSRYGLVELPKFLGR